MGVATRGGAERVGMSVVEQREQTEALWRGYREMAATNGFLQRERVQMCAQIERLRSVIDEQQREIGDLKQQIGNTALFEATPSVFEFNAFPGMNAMSDSQSVMNSVVYSDERYAQPWNSMVPI